MNRFTQWLAHTSEYLIALYAWALAMALVTVAALVFGP